MHALLSACRRSPVFGESGLPCFPRLGDIASKLAVVFGDNATGKSLMLSTMLRHTGSWEGTGMETFSVSMRMRTNQGMGASIMYGSERASSTGATSLRAVTGALYNAKQRPHPVWLMFDEPDIGLSDKYAAAMGAFLAQEVNALPEHIRGVSIITHSRALLRQLLANLAMAPHEVSMGKNQSLLEFLDANDEAPASIDELLRLTKHASETRRRVAALLGDEG
jgi:ABC-type cobalamin/Fe3+-siderophores transport system ATPase subunit